MDQGFVRHALIVCYFKGRASAAPRLSLRTHVNMLSMSEAEREPLIDRVVADLNERARYGRIDADTELVSTIWNGEEDAYVTVRDLIEVVLQEASAGAATSAR